VNVAIIGGGFGARVVAPAFEATSGCRVLDVVSPRDEAAVRSLVERPDVDLVSVHSPPFLHARDVRWAIDAGKAVLCDKPFAMNAIEATEMLAAAESAGVVHLCNFEFRYHPARIALRDIFLSGAIGRLEHVQWTHVSAGTRAPLRPYGWLFDADSGGGWIGAWASHAVDTLRFLTGHDVEMLSALRRIDVRERIDRDGETRVCTAEDGLSASLIIDGAATVSIDSSYAAMASPAPRLTLFGTEAALEDVGDRRIRLVRSGGVTDVFAYEGEGERERHGSAMGRFAEVVRDAVENGAAPAGAPTFADGYACDLVLDQLRAAPITRLHHTA
jgi:predicted dehydrogenase